MRYVLAILGVLLAAYLFTGVTQVRPGERAVVRRFGRVVDKPGPGLHVGLPWGMDRVDRVPVDRVQRVLVGYQPEAGDDGLSTPPGQLLTGDYNLVNVQLVVDYAVREDQVEDYVVQADRADALVARTAEAVLAEWVAGHTVDEVLLRGKIDLPRYLLEHAERRLAPYRLGIQLQTANVAYLLPPDEVKPDFDAVTRAQTAIRTREFEARQEAERRRREAEIEKIRRQQLTKAFVNERLSLARAEADGFLRRLATYRQLRQENPDVLTAIWWEEMGRVFARLKENGRLDLLDNHVGPDGLDLTLFGPQPRRR